MPVKNRLEQLDANLIRLWKEAGELAFHLSSHANRQRRLPLQDAKQLGDVCAFHPPTEDSNLLDGVGIRDRLDGVHDLDTGQVAHGIPPFVQIQIDTGCISVVRRRQWLAAMSRTAGWGMKRAMKPSDWPEGIRAILRK